MGDKVTKTISTIADLQPDPRNANEGTERGAYMVGHSLEQYGAGRSILADGQGVVIAGNKTLQAAADLGIPVRVVETDGHELVVVQRTDLDLLGDDDRARLLAYADNRASEVGLQWDAAEIALDLDAGIDLSGLFQDFELAEIGIELATDEQDGVAAQTLVEQFLIPPFSVLDARQGYWQERKRVWLALGIQSELGRGGG